MSLRWIRRALLLIGLVAVGYTGYVYLDASGYQAYQDWAFDQEALGNHPSVVGFILDRTRISRAPQGSVPGVAVPSTGDSDRAATAHTRSGREERSGTVTSSMIGRISIPRVQVHAMIKEGIDDATLRRAVGHIPGTAMPGEDGNFALAAHRDSFFRGLKDLRKDDRIVVETRDRDYEYIVESLRIVGPDDVEVLAQSKNATLTLVTCYPFNYVGNAPRRFIVQARQASASQRGIPGS